jgi:hypothetical protein
VKLQIRQVVTKQPLRGMVALPHRYQNPLQVLSLPKDAAIRQILNPPNMLVQTCPNSCKIVALNSLRIQQKR